MQTDTGKRTGGHVAGTIVLVFLLVYFLFPVAFAWPVVIIYGRENHLPRPLQKFFRVFYLPVGYLTAHVPPYKTLVQREAEWLDIR